MLAAPVRSGHDFFSLPAVALLITSPSLPACPVAPAASPTRGGRLPGPGREHGAGRRRACAAEAPVRESHRAAVGLGFRPGTNRFGTSSAPHAGQDLFVTDGAFEYVLVLAVAALALGFNGGAYALHRPVGVGTPISANDGAAPLR